MYQFGPQQLKYMTFFIGSSGRFLLSPSLISKLPLEPIIAGAGEETSLLDWELLKDMTLVLFPCDGDTLTFDLLLDPCPLNPTTSPTLKQATSSRVAHQKTNICYKKKSILPMIRFLSTWSDFQ